MTQQSQYVMWFRECVSESLPQVGGKNASLGEMTQVGIPVPPGFAVTTAAYEEAMTTGGIKDEVHLIVSRADPEDVTSLNKASESIRQLIESRPMLPQIEEAISSAYRVLAEECNVANLPVAVRSSATAEDLPGASFAGQQETFLWVKEPEQVIDKVKVCWSSLFTPRAISYRVKMNFAHEKVLISVGVQKMVNARAAGVMFTLNPSNGDRSKILIEGNWGFGESVVSGEATPDSFLMDKVSFDIIKRQIAPKTMQRALDSTGKVEFIEVPAEKQMVPCLSDEELMEIARLGKLIERHYGKPQDIEWAIDEDLTFPANVLILQSRPETVWSQKEREQVWEAKGSLMDQMMAHLKEGRKLR